MELVVEDGTGVPNANSYTTVAFADDILSINIHSTWELLDEEIKKRLLMWATRLLDERVRWFGKKMYQTGWLAWPRSGARDVEGYAIDDNLVPRQVQIATALLAEHLAAGNPELTNDSANLKSLQVDVISLEFDTNKNIDKYPSEIRLLLENLGRVSMGRGGPKFIVMY